MSEIIVCVKKCIKKNNQGGEYQWLINFTNNFFCYSRQPLEKDNFYKISYYRGNSGFFRIGEAHLAKKKTSQTSQTINYNYNIKNQNIFLMNWNDDYNCLKPYCVNCLKQEIKKDESRFCSEGKFFDPVFKEEIYKCNVKHWTIYQGKPFMKKEERKIFLK